jgi:hypothetical protein
LHGSGGHEAQQRGVVAHGHPVHPDDLQFVEMTRAIGTGGSAFAAHEQADLQLAPALA